VKAPDWFLKRLKRINPRFGLLFHKRTGVWSVYREMGVTEGGLPPPKRQFFFREVSPGIHRLQRKRHTFWHLVDDDGTPWNLEQYGSYVLSVLQAGDTQERALSSNLYHKEKQEREDAALAYEEAGEQRQVAQTIYNKEARKKLVYGMPGTI